MKDLVQTIRRNPTSLPKQHWVPILRLYFAIGWISTDLENHRSKNYTSEEVLELLRAIKEDT